MSTGELALTALVALIVLGPERLPTAMRQLASLVKKAKTLQRQFGMLLEEHHPAQQLEENLKKAEEADKKYV